MWLKLTFVFLQPLKGKPKESMSIVQQQRLNFDKVTAYFEANPDQMNNPSENARFNTVIDIGDPKLCFWVKETVEQIDDMLAMVHVPRILYNEPKSDIFDRPSKKEGEWQ